MRRSVPALVLAGMTVLLALPRPAPGGAPVEGARAMRVTSSAFKYNQPIPVAHTCQGDDVSPALDWQDLPAGTKSLALIVDDPDAPDPAAPKMVWVHWVVYDLPPQLTGLPGDVRISALPSGVLEGLNDWKRKGWRGPCPPSGRHRYFFKLYALDQVIGELDTPDKSSLEGAMQGHVLAVAVLMGTYEKAGR